MKKFFAVACLVATIFICGCGGEKSAEKVPSILLKESLWVADSDNLPYLNDAIARKDSEYLKQLMLEGKVFLVERDTKVTRFGVAAEKDHVLIQFNEGRYTNKTGYTHASNVVAEKDFHAYVEKQKQKKIALIQESLASTEKYSEVIATGNLEEIESFDSFCLNKTNELKRFRQEPEKGIIEPAEMAVEIIFERMGALSAYKYFVKYSQKVAQEKKGTKNFRVYDGMKKQYENDISKHSQKADQLRQEFRDKYGF